MRRSLSEENTINQGKKRGMFVNDDVDTTAVPNMLEQNMDKTLYIRKVSSAVSKPFSVTWM